jgi:hypothetical protein
MSEEILEQTAGELEEEQQAVAMSSGEGILDESKAKVKEAKAKVKEEDEEEEGDEEEEVSEESEEEDEEEEEVEEAVSTPKTKAGMIKALYNQLNSMKKADLSDSFSKIMGSTLAEEEEEESDDDDEEEVKSGYKMENKKLKKEDLDINVKEDMAALVSGEDLSEEFKTKASTIFEAAVTAKVISEVNQRVDELETSYKKEISEAKEEMTSSLTEKTDGYLSYVVEEWMKENELAVERGVRSELVEDFMSGLKNLFTEHYIDIPEEKVDLVDDLFEKVEELEKKLDESVNSNVETKQELSKYKKDEAIRTVSEDLADTEREKLEKLSEGVDYEDDAQYKEKLAVIKENYFPQSSKETVQPLTEEVENTETDDVVEQSDAGVDYYAKALTRHNINN